MTKNVPVDLELKKAFGELHEKMLETTRKIQILDTQIASIKRQVEIAEMSDREICYLPPGVNIYEGVARMFLLSDQKAVIKGLRQRQHKLNLRISELTSHKKFLEVNLHDSTNNLRELVQIRKIQGEMLVQSQGNKANPN